MDPVPGILIDLAVYDYNIVSAQRVAWGFGVLLIAKFRQLINT